MGGECKGNWLYRGTTRNGGGGGEVCNITKERAREKSASSRGNKSISGIPIEHPETAASNQFQVYALNFSVSLLTYLWRSTCFDFLLSVCVYPRFHISIIYHVCVYTYTRQTFKSVLWENILRRCILLNGWSCKQLIEMIICWDERRTDMELLFYWFEWWARIFACLLLIFIQTMCLEKRWNFDNS